MAETKTNDSRQSKCPQCGSTDLAFVLTKPPMILCKKCGHEFAAH